MYLRANKPLANYSRIKNLHLPKYCDKNITEMIQVTLEVCVYNLIKCITVLKQLIHHHYNQSPPYLQQLQVLSVSH